MSVAVESAMLDWEAGYRRLLEAGRDPTLRRRLEEQIDAVTAILRRRIGGTFTLAELADVYAGSERWVVDAVEDEIDDPAALRTLATAGDAAFHLFARGAVDYMP
jgi:hypothetical protein